MQTPPDYLHWYPGALALARSLLSPLSQPQERAKDVVQQAVAQLISKGQHLDSYRQAWFFTVVRNACIDELRRQQRFSAEPTDSHEAPVQADPVTEVLADEQQQYMQQALLQLSFEQREILLLRDVNDLSYATIAQILNINAGTVMSRLHRARMALRQQLLGRVSLDGDWQQPGHKLSPAPKEAV